MMNIWEIIAAAFSIQALFMALLLLLNKKGDRTSNFIWSIFLVLFSFNIFYNVLSWSEIHTTLTQRLNYLHFIPLSLYGSLFYFYIKRMLLQDPIKKREVLLHLIPFILVVMLFSRYYILPLELRDQLQTKDLHATYLIVEPKIVGYFLGLNIFMYGLFTYAYFREHSNMHSYLKNWIKAICISFLFFSLAWASYFTLSYFNIIIREYEYALSFTMIVFVILTTFFGYIHPEIFNGRSLKEVILIKKYEKSGLTESLALDYKEKLITYIKNEKPYTNNTLCLSDLSEAIGVTKHHMSQIINEHFNMGFYDFINKLRVEQAVSILVDSSSDMNITETAYYCGFNNKVSFYKAFKKFTGTIPTVYLKRSIVN